MCTQIQNTSSAHGAQILVCTDTEYKQCSWCSNTCVHRYRTQAVLKVLKYLCAQIQNTGSAHGAQILVHTDTEHKQCSWCSNTCVHRYRTQAVLMVLKYLCAQIQNTSSSVLKYLCAQIQNTSSSVPKYLCAQIQNTSSAHYTYFHLLTVNEISAHSVNIFDKRSFNCLSFFAPILITSNLKWQKLLSIVSLSSFKTQPPLRHLLAHCTNKTLCFHPLQYLFF